MRGAVFAVAGSSGKLTVATLNHAAMAVNRTELGSVVLDVTGRELVARFINSTGVVRDTFSIVHNTAPLANEATFTGNEDAPLAVTLGGTDVENDVLTYAITTPPAVGTLTGTVPALTYTPPVDFQGSTTFQFTVNDGRVTSAPVTVTLNISGVNDAPLALGQSVSTAEDVPAAITLAGVALALMETLADYGVGAYFGLTTFSTGIYKAWLVMNDRIAAAQLAAVLLLVVGVVLTAERAAQRRCLRRLEQPRRHVGMVEPGQRIHPPRQPLPRAARGAKGFRGRSGTGPAKIPGASG